jgi:hypothetical protein
VDKGAIKISSIFTEEGSPEFPEGIIHQIISPDIKKNIP